ncbi:hypothetical protein CHS0354_014691 [Potamilus streckersoni]|uniref:Uncharacterized protein n=1 Tax=Potamilus streckersoni TaxID=2493646 RepID=A0AAE0SQS3_9BIVA|nr:hypothetical protein CHS0354_014691 [Potamilus streckersoni]
MWIIPSCFNGIKFVSRNIKNNEFRSKANGRLNGLTKMAQTSNPPTLSMDMTRYNTVPRRYDDTRPVIIQGFAHKKILGIGHELHQRSMEKAEAEKLQAISEAERAVWEQAEQIKVEALEKAKAEAAKEHEKEMKKLKKAYEKKLKEEALQVEMQMQKLAAEQVKEEREQGEKQLKEAVHKTEQRCEEEQKKAIAQTQADERQKAATDAARVAKEGLANAEKLEKTLKKAEEDKLNALKMLADKKDLEKIQAVSEAETRERNIFKEKQAALTRQNEAVIEKLRCEINDRELEKENLLKTIDGLENNKKVLERCLEDTRHEFQDFINRLRAFDKGQAEFLLKPIYLDELEKKGIYVKDKHFSEQKKGAKK